VIRGGYVGFVSFSSSFPFWVYITVLLGTLGPSFPSQLAIWVVILESISFCWHSNFVILPLTQPIWWLCKADSGCNDIGIGAGDISLLDLV